MLSVRYKLNGYALFRRDSIIEGLFFSGVGLTSPGTAATSGLLYSPK
jgi:hypothetical protein